MEPQLITPNRKPLLKNDTALVCGMFVIYGLCFLGLIGAALWGVNQRNKQISQEVTSTAYAVATQQANITSTASVRATELAGYEFIDTFDSNYYR